MTDVCQLLKETRASRGLSLEEVAQKTYIKAYYLEALEEGLLDRLPAPVHTFGYIRLYAKLLGLDGGALVAQFQQQKGLNSNSHGQNSQGNGRGSGPLTEWAAGFMAHRPGSNGQAAPQSNGSNSSATGYELGLGAVSPVGNADVSGKPLPQGLAPLEASNGHSQLMPAFEPADQRPSQQAQQLLAAAERDARQLVRGAESYADDVLSTLELEVDKALQIIRNGRQFLEMRRQNGSTGN
jgi:transcriptional regulator with XRE-family HTH domain